MPLFKKKSPKSGLYRPVYTYILLIFKEEPDCIRIPRFQSCGLISCSCVTFTGTQQPAYPKQPAYPVQQSAYPTQQQPALYPSYQQPGQPPPQPQPYPGHYGGPPQPQYQGKSWSYNVSYLCLWMSLCALALEAPIYMYQWIITCNSQMSFQHQVVAILTLVSLVLLSVVVATQLLPSRSLWLPNSQQARDPTLKNS